MGINFPRHLRDVFDVRNDVRAREVIEALQAIVRDTPQGAATPVTGPLTPAAKDLNVVRVTSTPYAMGNEDVLLVDNDAVGGDVTIELQAVADTFSYPRWIKQLGNTGSVIIVPDGSETIDGAAQLILGAIFNTAAIISDDTEWWII